MFRRGVTAWYQADGKRVPVLARVIRSSEQWTDVILLRTKELLSVDNDLLRESRVQKAEPQPRCTSPGCRICNGGVES